MNFQEVDSHSNSGLTLFNLIFKKYFLLLIAHWSMPLTYKEKNKRQSQKDLKKNIGREDTYPYGDMLSVTDLTRELKVVQKRSSWKDGEKV